MAKKNNRFAEEIDLTPFSWITAGSDADTGKPGCGGCHPGGGGLEYDRDGYRYDLHLRNNPGLSTSLDGDYFQSKWDKTGVIEADCLICHLPRYLFKERIKSFEKLNFQWAIVAGSGVGLVKGAVKDGENPRVVYNKRFFNEDGKIVLNLESEPESENCLYCHGPADMIKRGFSWNDHSNHDLHNARNIKCAACHPGNREHQIAKGKENLSTVRDDLDNTMRTCKVCHETGYMGAPKPAHRAVRPNHLEKLSCEACHIPQLGRSSASGLDVSSGKVRVYPRDGAKKVGEELLWFPEMILGPDNKLYPVNSFQPNLYTNREAEGMYIPLFAKEIEKGYHLVRNRVRQERPGEPLINTLDEIHEMLRALSATLQDNPRFGKVHPCYHSNGMIYSLDSINGVVKEKDTAWPSERNDFNISHNVAPIHMALGARGCADCHSERAAIFSSWLAGKRKGEIPSHFRTLPERVDTTVYYLRKMHQYNWTKKYLIPLLFSTVFILMLFYENRKPPRDEPFHNAEMLPLVALMLLVRNLSFLFLALTGMLFFFNNNHIIHVFFQSPEAAVILHWSGGVVFLLSIIGCFAVSRRLFARHDLDLCYLCLPGDKHVIVLMALTGSAMIFREHLHVDLLYICSIVHTFAAFVLLAVYAAKIYYGISRRLYVMHRSGQPKPSD